MEVTSNRYKALIWCQCLPGGPQPEPHMPAPAPGGREGAAELTASAKGRDYQKTTERRRSNFLVSDLCIDGNRTNTNEGMASCAQEAKAQSSAGHQQKVTSLWKAVCFSQRSLQRVTRQLRFGDSQATAQPVPQEKGWHQPRVPSWPWAQIRTPRSIPRQCRHRSPPQLLREQTIVVVRQPRGAGVKEIRKSQRTCQEVRRSGSGPAAGG